MAIKSGFFNSVNGDRKYDAKRFAEYFASFIGNGVFPNPSDSLQVMANNDMTVTVKAGKAWIDGFILINDDDFILSIDPADGVLNRINRIVLRYDVSDREIRVEVKKEQFASTPIAPTLQRDADAYELGIADIYVGNGVISINQGNITDLRQNGQLCGIVHGTVEQVDTTTLWNQYRYEFDAWFEDLKEVLDDNVAANLQNQINAHTSQSVTDAHDPILQGYSETMQTLEGQGTVNLDIVSANVFKVNVIDNIDFTFSIPNNDANSLTLILNVTEEKAITFPAEVKWNGNNVPDLTAEGIYVLTFIYVGEWLGFMAGEF